jgi:polyisoprenoid-binding protein YceI
MPNIVKFLRSWSILAVSLSAAAFATASALSFDFKDPKGVNNVAFQLDAPLESIAGTGTGITGTVSFDPANPAATTGRIVLATESLTVGNSSMRDHMLGPRWLDAKSHPEIVFELVSLQNIKTAGAVTTADAVGKLTLKGVTQEISAPVTLTHLPDKLGARINKPEVKGDLLVIRSTFKVSRGAFNIEKDKNLDKVADEIVLTMSIAGAATKA